MNDRRVLYVDLYPRRLEVRRAATRLDARLLALSMALLLLTATAGLLYLSQASTVAQLRYWLADNEHQQATLLEEIARLRGQVAASQSLASLERRVEELGLVDAPPGGPVVVYYVSTAEPAASEDGGTRRGPGPAASPSLLARLRALLAPEPAHQVSRAGSP